MLFFNLPLALDMGGSGTLHLACSCSGTVGAVPLLGPCGSPLGGRSLGQRRCGRGVRPRNDYEIHDCAARTYRWHLVLVLHTRRQRHFDSHQCFC